MGNTPFNVRCQKCARSTAGRSGRAVGYKVKGTGRVKEKPVERRTLYATGMVKPREVECLECGHVWWTTHPVVCPDHPRNKQSRGR